MPVNWSDGVLDGDLTTGLAYVTPAGGVVITPVAPIGLRDREAGTVGFTTSLAKPVGTFSREYLDEVIQPKAERFMGPPKRGWFWDRWLEAYYSDRVPVDVEVEVEHVLLFPGDDLVSAPPPQAPPKNGTGPRVAAKKLQLPHRPGGEHVHRRRHPGGGLGLRRRRPGCPLGPGARAGRGRALFLRMLGLEALTRPFRRWPSG